MKLIRQNSAPSVSKTLQRVIVDSSNEVILDSKTSLKIPVGVEAERPQIAEQGQIRFINTYPNWTPGDPIEGYYEAYHAGVWKELRFAEPREIHVQTFTGNSVLTQFGPLYNNDPVHPTSFVGNPASILVFIDNVYQIPTRNYLITQVGQDYFLDFGVATNDDPAPPATKPITVIHNFDK